MFFAPTASETQATLALSIFVGTLVYEDGATVLAATLSASGRLHPMWGIFAAFTGIWIGDIGLFVLGSSFRRFVERSHGLQQFLTAESVSRAQLWLNERGSWALVMSRAIPGSRLPLYLAAGALEFSRSKFVKVTGICAVVWVSLLFAIWRIFCTGSHPMKCVPWILTGAVLLGPWLLKRITGSRINEARPRETENRATSACAA